MRDALAPNCYNCKNQNKHDRFACSAFPVGIPDAIFNNEADHRKPFDGDNGIRFDPIDPNREYIIDEPLDPDTLPPGIIID